MIDETIKEIKNIKADKCDKIVDISAKIFNKVAWLGFIAIDVMEETLKEFPLYVYEAEVDAKLIGRGQCPINEYTVDVPIKPDCRYDLTWKDIKPYIVVYSVDKFKKFSEKTDTFSKDKTNLREKLIFRNTMKTKVDRCLFYDNLRN